MGVYAGARLKLTKWTHDELLVDYVLELTDGHSCQKDLCYCIDVSKYNCKHSNACKKSTLLNLNQAKITEQRNCYEQGKGRHLLNDVTPPIPEPALQSGAPAPTGGSDVSVCVHQFEVKIAAEAVCCGDNLRNVWFILSLQRLALE